MRCMRRLVGACLPLMVLVACSSGLSPAEREKFRASQGLTGDIADWVTDKVVEALKSECGSIDACHDRDSAACKEYADCLLNMKPAVEGGQHNRGSRRRGRFAVPTTTEEECADPATCDHRRLVPDSRKVNVWVESGKECWIEVTATCALCGKDVSQGKQHATVQDIEKHGGGRWGELYMQVLRAGGCWEQPFEYPWEVE